MKILTAREYEEILQQGLHNGEITEHSDGVEHCLEVQNQWITGRDRAIRLRDGLHLKIGDFYNQDRYAGALELQHKASQPLTLSFQLRGYVRVRTQGIGNDYYEEKAGENYLFFVPETQETEEYPAQERLQALKIRVQPHFLRTLISSPTDSLPAELNPLLEGRKGNIFHRRVGKITPEMQLAVRQILQCPYRGITKCLYLEGKVLQLIALQFAQMTERDCVAHCNLHNSDIECIHQAKAILLSDLNNPPSLLELARQVGINDYKLKRGFRQVFGTTVFGCLQAHRLERGKQLLAERELNVAGVARAVGYASQSRFCDAFKRQFAMTPRDYLASLH
ncbi:helix-turn-helix transcriptional regulator [Lusitaniella coriacea]|uniref:helix-turn-helix transcriptional regulator n=1 Tax=Lusitaniella coriacea TaxID=1983105 RepID=UPI003CE98D07